jgi:hypothetical protein
MWVKAEKKGRRYYLGGTWLQQMGKEVTEVWDKIDKKFGPISSNNISVSPIRRALVYGVPVEAHVISLYRVLSNTGLGETVGKIIPYTHSINKVVQNRVYIQFNGKSVYEGLLENFLVDSSFDHIMKILIDTIIKEMKELSDLYIKEQNYYENLLNPLEEYLWG